MTKEVALGNIRITMAQAKKLDDLRRKEDDLPTRVEMMRRLLERAK